MTESRKLRVFLCHAAQDKPVVRELYQRLGAEGWIDPWLDEERLLPGQDWQTEIEKSVEAADAIIVCLSSTSVNKEGYIQRELKYVLDLALEKPESTVFVIPLRLDEVQSPRRLRAWQFADYFPENNREQSYQKLLLSLKLRAETAFTNTDTEKLDKISKPGMKVEHIILRYLSGNVDIAKAENIRDKLEELGYSVKVKKEFNLESLRYRESGVLYGSSDCRIVIEYLCGELADLIKLINRPRRFDLEDKMVNRKSIVFQFVDNSLFVK